MQTKFQEELFSCTCTDINHSILVQYVPMANTPPESDDVMLTMTVHKGDYEYEYKFFKKMLWRLKIAFRLLFTGHADFSVTWMPNNNSEMNLKKLTNFLQGIVNDQDRRISEHDKTDKCSDGIHIINHNIDLINII